MEKISNRVVVKGARSEEFFQKTLILVFEVRNRATTESVFGWLHDYSQRQKSTFFEIFTSLFPSGFLLETLHLI